MRYILFSLMVMAFISCKDHSKHNTTKTQTTENNDTVPDAPPDTPPPGVEIEPVKSDTVFTAFGNEPFWAVYVIPGKKIIFHPADGSDVEVPYAAPKPVDSNTERYSSFAGNATIIMTVTKKPCSDGMSDNTHEYAVSLKVNNTPYEGCGRIGTR